jgi:acyl-coenzyme A thioesterase PaaI-like protein
MAETLSTKNTIHAWQSFFKAPTSTAAADSNVVAGEVYTLLSLGDGMNGYPHIMHGGMSSTIMDEVMWLVASFHTPPDTPTYTAFITVNFKKSIPTPSVVLCRASLEEKSKGRKLFTKATLENGEGLVYATAESLFIEVDKKAPKL